MRARDDVGVREDIAVRREDHAGARAGGAATRRSSDADHRGTDALDHADHGLGVGVEQSGVVGSGYGRRVVGGRAGGKVSGSACGHVRERRGDRRMVRRDVGRVLAIGEHERPVRHGSIRVCTHWRASSAPRRR
jgi:hypothetical protein